MIHTPTLCIYHSSCADGFSAAWVVRQRFGKTVRFHPGVYGEAPPDVSGEHVLLVDFSYKASVLREMVAKAASVVVLDHHKTALADLAPLFTERLITGAFDMSRSGAVITWECLFPERPVPQLLLHVQDRDLWQFKLPYTREIQACVFSHPYDFELWTYLVEQCALPDSRTTMISEGAAIERKHFKDLDELLKITARRMVIGGISVPVANLPYTMSSDAAGRMAEGEPFAACYFDGTDARMFSLRSRGENGADVSEIASQYGGGGHRNASGFQTKIGWEGDT